MEGTACLGNSDPVAMKVYAPVGEKTFDSSQTTEEAQACADRREVDAMLKAGKDLAAVL